MHSIRKAAERLAQEAADAAHIAALGIVVAAGGVGAAAAQKAEGDTQKKDRAMSQPTSDMDAATGPLAAELEARKREFAEQADAQTVALFEQGVIDVAELGLTDSALNTGDPAPRFELPDAAGGTTTLETMLADGPVVVTFYRGGWCPYCNIQLRAYQERLDEIASHGASLVAISPEQPDASLSTREKNDLKFHVLSDAGNQVADAFGLRYRLPSDIIDAFRGRFDLEQTNGDDSWTLPLGATYVIDQDGTIAWAYLSADYRERAETQDVIDALAALKTGG
ncbi:MAG: peroxiredoxin-like family protein [Planctomycetota bacterium]